MSTFKNNAVDTTGLQSARDRSAGREPSQAGFGPPIRARVGNKGMQHLMRARLVQRQALTISEPNDPAELEADKVAKAVVQRMSHDESHIAASPGSVVQRACSQCEEPVVNRAAAGAEGELHADASVQRGIEALIASGGQPLPESVRGPMESQFQRGFGGVRIHMGADANVLARSIDAKAFTFGGSHIAFGQGQFSPETIAHELTHVVQQGGSTER
jgi:hypothetical protein